MSAATTHAFSHVKRVAIIGGGVAGLNTARALAARGLQCTIYEANDAVGGVWRSNYSGYGLQVPKNLYEFLDHPFPGSDWHYPSGSETQAYIQGFAQRHVEPVAKIRLSTRVSALAPRACGARGWDVSTSAGDTQPFDYVVAATGGYSTPFLPALPGREAFPGAVLHSTAFTAAEAAGVRGKHVVVVGGAKSALDCALAAAGAGAASTTLLSRAARWGTPRKIAGLIPFQYVFLSRFGQALVSWFKGAWPTAPASVGAVHAAIAPIMRPVFGLVEALFAFQLGLRGLRAPQLDVVADFYGYGAWRVAWVGAGWRGGEGGGAEIQRSCASPGPAC
jgi:dimethylaniline monooxygenase (N-oxide forming)